MCKIAVFTNVKNLNLKEKINSIGNTLLKLEDDGFGYALQGEQGVFGEKCVAKTFASRLWAKETVKLPIVKPTYEKFGTISQLTGPGIFHGRTSTNVKGLLNCHPMQRDGWNLIHNGVVGDIGPEYEKTTQNDSEDVLFRLIEGIDSVEKHLEGYYAFAAIDPHGRLHVARDAMASLFIAWSKVYESYVIATTAELLKSLNRTLKAKLGPIDEIYQDKYMIFQGNEMIHSQDITPLGYTMAQARHSMQSLGRSVYSSPNVIDVSTEGHHRGRRDVAFESASEEGWPLLSGIDQEKEDAYYAMRYELDNMDASYLITDEFGKEISVIEFKKLDPISQEMCRIERADGTTVDTFDDETFRKQA